MKLFPQLDCSFGHFPKVLTGKTRLVEPNTSAKTSNFVYNGREPS